jgi:hypothetical protein
LKSVVEYIIVDIASTSTDLVRRTEKGDHQDDDCRIHQSQNDRRGLNVCRGRSTTTVRWTESSDTCCTYSTAVVAAPGINKDEAMNCSGAGRAALRVWAGSINFVSEGMLFVAGRGGNGSRMSSGMRGITCVR